MRLRIKMTIPTFAYRTGMVIAEYEYNEALWMLIKEAVALPKRKPIKSLAWPRIPGSVPDHLMRSFYPGISNAPHKDQ